VLPFWGGLVLLDAKGPQISRISRIFGLMDPLQISGNFLM
jgi:hypothetical protein